MNRINANKDNSFIFDEFVMLKLADKNVHQSPPKGYPESKKEYADPKNYKYPIDTEKHVRAAWSYINMPRNQSGYSSGEVAAIKGRIKSKFKQYGIDESDKEE